MSQCTSLLDIQPLLGEMLHGLGKEGVIAIPGGVVVAWDQEQIGARKLFEQQRAVASAGDGIAERGRQAMEKGRAQQKVLDRGRLRCQHFVKEILQNVAMASGKGVQKALDFGWRLPVMEGKGRQAQAGGPAFGARL